MFTGIVQATCDVVSIKEQSGLKTFEVKIARNAMLLEH